MRKGRYSSGCNQFIARSGDVSEKRGTRITSPLGAGCRGLGHCYGRFSVTSKGLRQIGNWLRGFCPLAKKGSVFRLK